MGVFRGLLKGCWRVVRGGVRGGGAGRVVLEGC